ncbi:hypothetical protein EVG20_g10164 [Dentipellis fragilis]|uniref:Uncharacterized protein n=1 Tax=Dentipellis fragilis TaxID=205917 RepID=A0A4Y9XV86_9AGAM|nr:hypothetical protein EVG20_g10164 [Dentipellis fragilis]
MKFSVLSSIVFLLPLLAGQVSAGVAGRAGNGKNGAGSQGQGGAAGKGGANAAKGGAAAAAAGKGGNAAGKGGAAASSSAAATSTAAAAAGTAAAAAGGAGGDAQTSLTLDPSVIAKGFEQDGQAQQEAGQVASLTSSNNFINFCATVPNLPITNGQQIKTGSCNPAPMGVIASTNNMPSGKFTNPKNLDDLPANQAFTVTMAIQNLETGNFVNANSNYYSAPQQVNAQGNIVGHSHFVIEKLSAIDQTTPTVPGTFAFFKGVNGAAVNGVISADVTAGLPAGVYRLASINAAANHQPVLVAIAQHGSLDDMVYFTVGGAGNAGAGAAGAANATAAAGGKGGNAAAAGTAASAAAGTASSAAATSSAAAGGKGAAAAAGKGAAGAGKGAAAGAAGAKGAAGAGAKGGAAGAQGAKGGAQGAKGGKNRRSRLARERY